MAHPKHDTVLNLIKVDFAKLDIFNIFCLCGFNCVQS